MSSYSGILEREIVTTRVLNWPVEVVFAAFSDPEQLRDWWGPKGFTNTFHEFDFRTGGKWLFTMHGPNGADYENEMRFVEIVRGERIVMDHFPGPRFLATIEFDAVLNGTKVTMRQLFETAQLCGSIKRVAVPANEENMDRLMGVLAE